MGRHTHIYIYIRHKTERPTGRKTASRISLPYAFIQLLKFKHISDVRHPLRLQTDSYMNQWAQKLFVILQPLRRNCLLKQVIEGKIKGQIEVTRRQGRRRKKLQDDLKDRRGYCELKEEALDRTMWKKGFARGFGPVV